MKFSDNNRVEVVEFAHPSGFHKLTNMSFQSQSEEFNYLVRQAAQFLGAPGRGVLVDWAAQQQLERIARLEARSGVDQPLPLHGIGCGRKGHRTIVGLERYRLDVDGEQLHAVKVCNGFASELCVPCQDPWVVPVKDYARFYELIRRLARQRLLAHDTPPIMPVADQQRLFNNTIGFLKQGRELLERYGVPQKRGVLLYGPPGNGKTMACRWLFAQCRRLGLDWRYVDMDNYEKARAHNATGQLFRLNEPGIILFDDFELGMRDREQVGPSPHHSTLLSELDGVEQRQGVVYLFTTNARLTELDPAFMRRGRIDQLVQFSKPCAVLRRRLILELWHPEIVQSIEIEAVVGRTEGRSFAEVAELKKLLVLSYLDTGKWDWEQAWESLVHCEEPKNGAHRIGFGRAELRQHDPAMDLLLGNSF